MKLHWDPKYLGWKYLNYVIVVLGLIVGIGVWFVPNKWAEPEIAAGMAEQTELRSLRRSANEFGLVCRSRWYGSPNTR